LATSEATTPTRRATPRRWPWVIAVFTLAALLAVAGYEAWERPARRAAQATRQALAAGRYADADRSLARWLELRPRSAEAQYFRAKAGIAQGRARDIYEGLKEAEALGYPEESLAVLRALIDAQHGRIAQALPVLAKAFAATPASAPDLMLDEALARVCVETYDFSHAGAVLARWAADAPSDPRPPLWHAKVHIRRNAEPEIIVADYREALKRDPNSHDARLGLAEQLERAQQNQEAAVAYSAALAVQPDDPAVNLGAGRNALALGDETTALRHLDRALELDPDRGEAHLERAKLALRRGDPKAALSHLDRAVARIPSDPGVHYQRSLALKRLGRDEEAAREQESFTRLQRDRRQLDDLQEQLGETPNDAALQAQVARWMFDHSFEDEALRWCHKILIDKPAHAETCLLLADYYARRGETDQADAYRRLAAQGPPRRP